MDAKQLTAAVSPAVQAWLKRARGIDQRYVLLGGAALVVAGAAGTALALRNASRRNDDGGAPEQEDDTGAARGSAAVVSRTVTINKSRAELYAFWRDFSNLASFMENVESVTVESSERSHWIVKAPGGRTVEWDAIVTRDEPDALIAWEAAPGADVRNSGVVEFRDAPGGRGTEVHATIAYEPPFGQFGRWAARMMQREPGIQARRDLRRFKQLMETGEIATTEEPGAAPSGRAKASKSKSKSETAE